MKHNNQQLEKGRGGREVQNQHNNQPDGSRESNSNEFGRPAGEDGDNNNNTVTGGEDDAGFCCYVLLLIDFNALK